MNMVTLWNGVMGKRKEQSLVTYALTNAWLILGFKSLVPQSSHLRMYWEAVGPDMTNLTTNQTFVPFLTYSFPYTLQSRGILPPYSPALLFGGIR